MIIVPNQPFGLGDIIFCQTLVRHIADGRRIVWPVFPQFVEGLNRAYPDIEFVHYKKFPLVTYERKDQFEIDVHGYGLCTVLPIRFADQLLRLPYDDCMKAKYQLYELDWERWRECAMWKRGGEPEFSLTSIINEEVSYDDYNLINTTFGSDAKLNVNISLDNEFDNVNMRIMPPYSLFDWGTVIQHATEIHTVNTSIIYLLEMLDLKAKEVHLYQRTIPGQTFSNIEYILKKHKYVFHG